MIRRNGADWTQERENGRWERVDKWGWEGGVVKMLGKGEPNERAGAKSCAPYSSIIPPYI